MPAIDRLCQKAQEIPIHANPQIPPPETAPSVSALPLSSQSPTLGAAPAHPPNRSGRPPRTLASGGRRKKEKKPEKPKKPQIITAESSMQTVATKVYEASVQTMPEVCPRPRRTRTGSHTPTVTCPLLPRNWPLRAVLKDVRLWYCSSGLDNRCRMTIGLLGLWQAFA